MVLPHPELAGDFHVHSQFSDDASSTMVDNVAAAASAGLTELRLIDHVRRGTPWVPDYLAAIAALDVPAGLTLMTGVEAKILDAAGTLDIPDDLIVGPGGVDAIVIADHQFPGPDGPWTPQQTIDALSGGRSADWALDTLIDAMIAAMRAYPGSQLAHPFSLLPKIGLSEDDLTDLQVNRWVKAAAETGALIEVNEKWACPGVRVIRAALAGGARVVAATDSHVSEDVGAYAAVTTLLDLALESST